MTNNLRERGVAMLPDCYSIEFYRCLAEQPNSYPGCGEMLAAYLTPEANQAMNDVLTRLPLCAEEQAFYDRTKAALPDCYTQELDDCLNSDDPAGHIQPGCADISQAYDLNNNLVEHLPYCSMQARAAGPNWLLIAGGVALVGAVAFAVGRAR